MLDMHYECYLLTHRLHSCVTSINNCLINITSTVKERLLIKIFLADQNSANFPYTKEFIMKQTNHLTRLCKQYSGITAWGEKLWFFKP